MLKHSETTSQPLPLETPPPRVPECRRCGKLVPMAVGAKIVYCSWECAID